MAWTGTATVVKVNDRLVRITGVSLLKDASGTIGFAGETVAADIELPALPDWLPRAGLTFAQMIEARITITTDVTTPAPISVAKSGTTQDDFKLTFHNDTDSSTGQDSPSLEIEIEIH